MRVEGSMGAMLQGVSQQPARIRLEGQVTEQVNMYSDVSTGLTSRPASTEKFSMDSVPTTMKFADVLFNQTKYIIGYDTGVLRMWDIDGVEQDIVYDGDADDYVGQNMKFHVFNAEGQDLIFTTNLGISTAMSSAADGYPFEAVYVSALGGAYLRTYVIRLTVNGTLYTSTYTTPDGTGAGDAADTASNAIMEALRVSLVAHSIPGVTISRAGSTLAIINTTALPMSAAISDGADGSVLRVANKTTDKAADLPKYAHHGAIVTILGDEEREDDYYVRFVSDEVTVVGTGFGTAGVWVEWRNPTDPHGFDLDTMPHVIEKTDTTEFTIGAGGWLSRRVGDADTSKVPSFIGLPISDIGTFESRLTFIGGPNTVMSRTNRPLDFWRKTALTVVDSDPIDMASSSVGSVKLSWIVPFDRDLIILSDPGESQFVVRSGGITPGNSSMPLTTSYEMSGLTRPVTTGRTLIFPFIAGAFSGLKEFFTNDAVATNGADTITEIQDKYIVGRINGLVSSKNYNFVGVKTDAEGFTDRIWVYAYLWEGTERRQASWSYWKFGNTIDYMFLHLSELYLIIRNDDDVAVVVSVDLNRTADVEGWHVMVDRKMIQTVASGEVRRDFDDAVIVQSTGCLNPGRETIPLSVTPDGDEFVYELNPEVCPDDALVYTGQRVQVELWPTMPVYKDRNGRAVTSAKIDIGKFKVHLTNSSDVEVIRTSPYRADRSFYPRRFPLDDEPLDPNLLLIMDYVLEVPWGERADRSQMIVRSTGVRPITIPEIEWEGQIHGLKRRVT